MSAAVVSEDEQPADSALVLDWRHDPWVHNKEAEVAALLKRLKIAHEYETRFYELCYEDPARGTVWGGFTPDFYLPAGPRRPALNLELTLADKGRPEMPRGQRRANLARLELKKQKIALTKERYGIETILVTYAVLMDLRRDNDHLDRLIKNALKRHGRRLRAA